MTAVLVLACSQKKRPDADPLPALARYDGPAFRVLRRHLRSTPETELTVLVLSARFGLIPADRPIPDYDQPMTPARADELHEGVCQNLRERIGALDVRRVGLCLGRVYRRTVAGFADDPPAGVAVQFLEGGQGRRLTALKAWLERESSRMER